MLRTGQLVVVVLIALVYHAHSRGDDEIRENNAKQRHKESKRLSPVYSFTVYRVPANPYCVIACWRRVRASYN